MKLFLLRHGDRSGGYGDVALSSEGQRQAHELAENPALQSVDVILCSPKLRTRQTIEPLASQLGITPLVEPAIDQRKSIETPEEFTQRVLLFLNNLPARFSGKNVLLCSHSDWLQTAILTMDSTRPDNAIHCFFSCAEYKVLVQKEGLWEVQ